MLDIIHSQFQWILGLNGADFEQIIDRILVQRFPVHTFIYRWKVGLDTAATLLNRYGDEPYSDEVSEVAEQLPIQSVAGNVVKCIMDEVLFLGELPAEEEISSAVREYLGLLVTKVAAYLEASGKIQQVIN